MVDLVKRLRPNSPPIGMSPRPATAATRTSARLAGLPAAFDLLVIKEDDARRGREEGEVAGLLWGAALMAASRRPRAPVPDEPEAARRALTMAEPDDLVVIFADEITAVWKAITMPTDRFRNLAPGSRRLYRDLHHDDPPAPNTARRTRRPASNFSELLCPGSKGRGLFFL